MDLRDPQARMTEEFFDFCRTNREVIGAVLRRKLDEFLEKATNEEIEEKFLRGEREHGDLTLEVLNRVDWGACLREEFVDGYNYVAMEMKKELIAVTPMSLEDR